MKKFNQRVLFVVACFLVVESGFAQDDHPDGFVVTVVVPGGAAANAGVLVGDVVQRIGGRPLESQADLDAVLRSHAAGDTVDLGIERAGKPIDLRMTFQSRPDGGPSFGVSLSVVASADGSHANFTGPTLTRAECTDWIEDRYQVESRVKALNLPFEADAERLLGCLAEDVKRMPSPMPVGWCDNSFKVHCSGLDLLTEIGEALIDSCERSIGEKLSPCANQRIFDRYTRDGLTSDPADCMAARDACVDGSQP